MWRTNNRGQELILKKVAALDMSTLKPHYLSLSFFVVCILFKAKAMQFGFFESGIVGWIVFPKKWRAELFFQNNNNNKVKEMFYTKLQAASVKEPNCSFKLYMLITSNFLMHALSPTRKGWTRFFFFLLSIRFRFLDS